MACYSPIPAWKGPGGKIVFKPNEGYYDLPLKVICGRCIGCRRERQRSWTIRCLHEAQMHEANAFLTLTYSDEHLPTDHSLNVSHWQEFAKRVRYHHGPFRFLHCGEYGETNHRPHYHALIFGHAFTDSIPVPGHNPKHTLRISESLSSLWPHGFHTVGRVTPETAAYTAAYTIKKKTGPMAESALERVDEETGECFSVSPEYATMSRRPGLGTSWFQKYWADVYPDNFVVLNGKKAKPPAFYDTLLERQDPELHRKMIDDRKTRVQADAENYTEDRLEVRATVLEAQMQKQAGVLDQ